jgi:hypothetical protein
LLEVSTLAFKVKKKPCTVNFNWENGEGFFPAVSNNYSKDREGLSFPVSFKSAN